MEERIVKLRFTKPVHFGNGRLSDSAFSCDAATLFSAMFIEALEIGLAADLLAAVKSGDLLISDTLPYIEDVLYLPKPMIRFRRDAAANLNAPAEGLRARKAAKKLAYIPASSLHGYLCGDFDSIAELDRFGVGVSSLQTKVNLTRKDGPDAKPYHVGSFSFAPKAGLYFIVRGSFDLSPILDRLSYSGLGGKRSSGFGRFEYDLQGHAPVLSTGKNRIADKHYLLLSSASPTLSELNEQLLDGAKYRLIKKSGFVQSATYSSSQQKRRDLYVFASGSVFVQRFSGDVFDVSDSAGSHPVYRYARAMWLEV